MPMQRLRAVFVFVAILSAWAERRTEDMLGHIMLYTEASDSGSDSFAPELAMTATGHWYTVGSGMYCAPGNGTTLGSGMTVSQCQDAALANPACGTYMYSNGDACNCVYGDCDKRSSSKGNNVYMYQACDVVKVSGSSEWKSKMGVYNRTEVMQAGMPVYKKSNSGTSYLFFSQSNALWIIGHNYSTNSGYLHSYGSGKGASCPADVPKWKQWDGSEFEAAGDVEVVVQAESKSSHKKSESKENRAEKSESKENKKSESKEESTAPCTPDNCDFDCPNVHCKCRGSCSGFSEIRSNKSGCNPKVKYTHLCVALDSVIPCGGAPLPAPAWLGDGNAKYGWGGLKVRLNLPEGWNWAKPMCSPGYVCDDDCCDFEKKCM